jgi:hypothetical protein
MNAFWITISFVVIGVMIALHMTSPPRGDWSIATIVTRYVTMGILVAIIWAISFRSQIEKLQITLRSMFILTLMEAVLLSAIRIFRPF